MYLSILPGWVPSDVIAVFLTVLIIAVLIMNRGRWWFMNVLAQDEPLIVAVGVTLAVANQTVASIVGAGRPETWAVVGIAITAMGLIVWYSDDLDISRPL